MIKPTLVILAAGIGSRYGSLKQFEGAGPNGELLMDYSIYNAIHAGFGQVIFVVPFNTLAYFRQKIEPKWCGKIAIRYAVQDTVLYQFGLSKKDDEFIPYGTALALLSVSELIHEPFCVIGAADFYGRAAFLQAANFLKSWGPFKKHMAMLAHTLTDNTLPTHDFVSRAVCKVNAANYLTAIRAYEHVYVKETSEGRVELSHQQDKDIILNRDCTIAMNFWIFNPSIFPIALEILHLYLLTGRKADKTEFSIEILVDYMVRNHCGDFEVFYSPEKWDRLIYREDIVRVRSYILELITVGEYPRRLFENA
jgi:hypothetical protein